MKVLHTSDWHLGKKIFKLDRFKEHELFLEWLLKTIKEEEIDLLLVSGDIFDSPSPPHQSLEHFFKFISQLSSESSCDTLIISGNHDSGMLLEAPKQLLKTHRVKIWGKLTRNPEEHWITIQKKNLTLDICAIPFFRTYELIDENNDDVIQSLKKYLHRESPNKKILLLHHLAGIYEATGSEHLISLSGIDSIPKDFFESFYYAALGHIHKPQKISHNAFYSGSPIQMRFSESTEKSVLIFDANNEKLNVVKKIIPSFRTLINLEINQNNWMEKIEKISHKSQLNPLVEVHIDLKSPNPELINEIRKKIEEQGLVPLSVFPTYQSETTEDLTYKRVMDLNPIELFKEFYLKKYPQEKEVKPEVLQNFNLLLQRAKDETFAP